MAEKLNRTSKDELIESKMSAQKVANSAISLRWQTHDDEIRKALCKACYFALRAADCFSIVQNLNYEKDEEEDG